ncbi:MAG: hypothetical protein HC788_00130 [Sphingopyxis sp.]|nr:hypothetical protein [Sphingopyxis sp.]
MNLYLSRIFSIVIVLFSIYSFSNAEIDFSYDYAAYIYYGDAISNLDINYMNKSVVSFFPFPYVLIPPFAQFEYGFVIVYFGLAYLGLSAAAIYLIVGTSSIAIRAFVIEKAKAGLILNFFTSLSFITLFEANAIRVGISSSLVMLSMYFISKRNNITALLLFILAFSMHVQALMYAFTFLSGVAVYFISSGRPNFRVFLVTVSVVMTSAAIPFINLPFGTKADDYLMRVSQATGLNILSGSSLIILFFALLSVAQVSHQKGSHWKWIWIGALFSFAQATLFMILARRFQTLGSGFGSSHF